MLRLRAAPILGLAALLGACGAPPEAPGQSVEAAEAGPVTLEFARHFGAVQPSAPLVGGGLVRIQYDRDRLYDIVNRSESTGHFATRYHCYGYGCCEVAFNEVYAQVRYDGGAFTTFALGEDGAVELSLPAQADHLEVYFEAPGYELRSYYCGCDAACAAENKARSGFSAHDFAVYDSRFGENYQFEVAPAPAAPPQVQRLAEGEWQSNHAAPSGSRYGWFWDSNVWVDMAVAPSVQPEAVGIRWTVDGWQTFNDSPAHFEGTRPDGQAQWGVDITPAKRLQSCYWCEPAPVTFEYAIFMTAQGTTSWNNNGGENFRLPLNVDL